MTWDWEREQEEYDRYLRELEHESWERNSLARMEDSAFGVSLQLRRFFEFSDCVLGREISGGTPIDPWTIWRQIQEEKRKWRRINGAPLSRWIGRTDKFSNFISHAKKLAPNNIPTNRTVLAIQSLLKAWADEMACFALTRHTPWQSVTFFYSLESELASIVFLLSDTDITSHADVLNQFRGLILTPLRKHLFSPLDFCYRRINKGDWQLDWDLPTNSLLEMCSLVVKRAMQGKHGDWITYFHLLHAVSELYRYRSALPFLMTHSARLRSHDIFIWDLNLALKLWLEILITAVAGSELMTDIIKVTRHQLKKHHKANKDIDSLEMRWELMEKIGLLDFGKKGLSSDSHAVFQMLRQNPISLAEYFR